MIANVGFGSVADPCTAASQKAAFSSKAAARTQLISDIGCPSCRKEDPAALLYLQSVDVPARTDGGATFQYR
jgi:hypothetical protein